MATMTYDPSRDITPAFLATVSTWIEASSEVFVLLRYLGGVKDYALCTTVDDFLSLIKAAPIGTDIEVFREPQLPIRGVASELLIARATEAIRPVEEYLWVTLERQAGSSLCSLGQMGCLIDLPAEWQEVAGQEIAIGALPDFTASDNENLVSASKGGIDGPR